jgi:hypothetical protein
MTGEQDDAGVVIKIRTPRSSWVWMLVGAPLWFALAAQQLLMSPSEVALGWPWLPMSQLAVGCLWVGVALRTRTLGVDLTPKSANVRSVRRRYILWQDVQAVVQYQKHGAWGVRLILESGKPVTLRAPTTWSGFGGAQYGRDFHRIGQWWLAHRGDAWHPVRAEAPRPPAQR